MLAPTIALFLRSADTYAYIAAGLDAGQSIESHRSLSELLVAVAEHAVSLVVTEAADEHGRSNASAVAAARAKNERLPILVVCSLFAGQSQLVIEVVRAGATGLLFRGVDNSRHAIRTALQQATQHSVARQICDKLFPLLPAAAVPLLRYAISRAADEPSVSQAARAVGVDRKTLFNWLRETRVSPSEFLNWIRLALAIGALESTSYTTERVALDLGFASGTAFRNMLHRYTGRTSSELRAPGSFNDILAMLRERLTREPEGLLPSINLAEAPIVRRRA